jgi:hypothetical protein
MNDLDLMQGLQDASRILNRARFDLSDGTMCLWQMVAHAQEHLDKQMRVLLAPPPAVAFALPAGFVGQVLNVCASFDAEEIAMNRICGLFKNIEEA